MIPARFVVGTAGTGVLMSRSAVPWLSVPALVHVVRSLHGCCAYLGLMIVSLHVGLHVPVLRGHAGLRGGARRPMGQVVAPFLAAIAAGTYAFFRLGVARKLLGQPSFPDAMTPLWLQLALHLGLAVPFVLVGAFVDTLSRRRGGAPHRDAMGGSKHD